ncbi:hypothetical protein FHP08_00635 [Zeimonas arvi]|uniref:Uncharacterized protein n=1 Tax=Zeimonas arvi TaxID=2498847 RepID=A0A5C8P438_9BURK|nr:hypothetical protein FHP08_00635 [Zeimonas arvi]
MSRDLVQAAGYRRSRRSARALSERARRARELRPSRRRRGRRRNPSPQARGAAPVPAHADAPAGSGIPEKTRE